MAEKGDAPDINIYEYDTLKLHRILRGGTQQAYAYVCFRRVVHLPTFRAVFQNCEESWAFSRKYFEKNPPKFGFQLDHFDPKLFAQLLYSTVMGVAKWEQDLWWLTFFYESVK